MWVEKRTDRIHLEPSILKIGLEKAGPQSGALW